MPDITDTLKADSTQLNAVDFGPSSRIYTIASVRVVAGDQPVNVRLVEEPDREYRPSKSMRRVLAACLGPDSDTWVGKRIELYADPTVKWGGKEVGGIKIKAVSGIDKPKKVMLQESSTVRKPHTVDPLADAPKPDIAARKKKAVEWFAGTKGVAQSVLEAHVGKPVAEWDATDLDELLKNAVEIAAPLPQSGADVDPNGVAS